ncbi:MAG: hypothetical protein OEY33_06005 [Bdellovibrionales bacterium]|jgi:hypothetical protein|nr:hypothetical protein [Bdellovibrionales bacterium]
MGEINPSDELIEKLIVTKPEEAKGETLIQLSSETKTLGPYKLSELLKEIESKDIKESTLKIKVIDEEIWKPLFDHPLIVGPQKLTLDKAEILKSDDAFLILSEGKRLGPFPKDEIIEKLRTKDILYTDYISFDHGFSWNHIYNIEEFYTGKNRDEEDLPPPPHKDALSKKITPKDKSELDTFINLLNTGKPSKPTHESSSSEDKPIMETPEKKNRFVLFLIIFGFAYLIYFTQSLFKKEDIARKKTTTKQRSTQKPFIKVESNSKKYGETPSRFNSKKINKTKEERASRFDKAQETRSNRDNDREPEDLVDPYDEIVKESERQAREAESLKEDVEVESVKDNSPKEEEEPEDKEDVDSNI